ncbi:hypothetical protein [Kitasatospora cineracea]|uniref:hypothetical protein n=1 Tax=Kitasatospora cineracea TaxID=88074 RepID=UPI00380DBFE7
MSSTSSAQHRADRIAAALHRLTGRPAATTRVRGGALRVTLRIDSPDVSAESALAMIRVLSLGDRYGHSTTGGWERVWAEVDPSAKSEGHPA